MFMGKEAKREEKRKTFFPLKPQKNMKREMRISTQIIDVLNFLYKPFHNP